MKSQYKCKQLQLHVQLLHSEMKTREADQRLLSTDRPI
jgi:hypothetical protein